MLGDQGPSIDSESREFSLSLVTRHFDSRFHSPVSVSLSLDVDESDLLSVLYLDGTLQIFRINWKETSLHMEQCITGVLSFTHCFLRLTDVEPFHKTLLPLTLVAHADSTLQAIFGTCETLFDVRLHLEQEYMQILFDANSADFRESFNFRLLPRSGRQISEIVHYIDDSGQRRFVTSSPIFLCYTPAVNLVSVSLDNLPATTSIAILTSSKALELSEGSEWSIFTVLLSAFGVCESFRKICYDLVGISVTTRSANIDSKLTTHFQNMVGKWDIPKILFDLIHLILCDSILIDSPTVYALATALGLISAWMFIASTQEQEKLIIFDYFDYYNRLLGFSLGTITNYTTNVTLKERNFPWLPLKMQEVPCVITWMEESLSEIHQGKKFNSFHFTTYKLCSLRSVYYQIYLFTAINSRFQDGQDDPMNEEESSIGLKIVNGFNDFLIFYSDFEMIGLESCKITTALKYFAAPIRELIITSMEIASSGFDENWIPSLSLVMGRTDIIWNSSSADDQHIAFPSYDRVIEGDHGDLDGFFEVEHISRHRFPDDRRVSEVCRMLRSSRSLYLKISHVGEGDVDPSTIKHKQQVKLLSLCRRSLAVVNGRGALTLGTIAPVVAEILPIPPLFLKGRCPPNNSEVRFADNKSLMLFTGCTGHVECTF